MRVAHRALNGEDIRLEPAAERHPIRYIPKERTTVLQRLAEARDDLATFEASLQAKHDLVAKLQTDAARHDYLPDITDEFPCQATPVTRHSSFWTLRPAMAAELRPGHRHRRGLLGRLRHRRP